MTARIADGIAALIREVDGDNLLGIDFAGAIASDLWEQGVVNLDQLGALTAFVHRTNPHKDMGAGALAELIVAEFDLDKEN